MAFAESTKSESPSATRVIQFLNDLSKHIPTHVWRSSTNYIRENEAEQDGKGSPFDVNTSWSENGTAHPVPEEGVGSISFLLPCEEVIDIEHIIRHCLAKHKISLPERQTDQFGGEDDDGDEGDEEYFGFDDDMELEPLISDSLPGYSVELRMSKYDFEPSLLVVRGTKGHADSVRLLQAITQTLVTVLKKTQYTICVLPYKLELFDVTVGDSTMKVEVTSGEGKTVHGRNADQPGIRFELKLDDNCIAFAVLSVRNIEVQHVGPTLEVIAVHKDHRRKGIGSWLLAFVEKWVLGHWLTSDRYLQLSVCDITSNYVWFRKRGVKIDLDEGMKILQRPLGQNLVL